MLKMIVKEFRNVIVDTLMKYDNNTKTFRYSRTSLTMFTAWMLAVYMALYAMYKEGFRYDVFATLVGVALGTKISDSVSQRIRKPKDGKDTKEEL